MVDSLVHILGIHRLLLAHMILTTLVITHAGAPMVPEIYRILRIYTILYIAVALLLLLLEAVIYIYIILLQAAVLSVTTITVDGAVTVLLLLLLAVI